MNTVIRTIREHIADENISFVFPSQTAASLWARKICTLGIVRSVAANRFLAWDRFKEEVISEKKTNREPASSVMRNLFADALIRKNAETVFLKSLIPPEYAREGGRIFAPFIARLLPSLFLWEKMMNARGAARSNAAGGGFGRTRDAEDEDYEAVKREYAAFLERHGLFEPSWEEAKIREGEKRYVLFFPELIDDFAEYDALLKAPQFIRITAETVTPSVPGGQNLVFYQSAREEIRSAVMELRRLHEEEGLAYEDMAVSVPELEEMEPNLLKEFSLHHIPVTRRAGKKLGETGVGRLFSLINECAASRFSFSSLKALILNDHIPWKEREKNKALVSFGIKYNCVSGYVQNNEVKDIWEEALREGYNDGGRELRPYYDELKKRILALVKSASFVDIRKYYFAFRGDASRRGFLDMENISEDDNAVLSRCIEELSSLIDLEEKFNDPALIPASPFGFFLSCLGEKEYVRAGQNPGVNIFKWRVAAAAPFACHFVLNASQSAASVLYQPMKFLRQDKRKALGLEDRDASGAFFLLCDTGEDEGFKSRTFKTKIRISASAQTFSGWAIPHSFFAQGKTVKAPPCPEDPYIMERRFWRDAQNAGGTPDNGTPGAGTSNSTAAGLQKIFPLQEKGYNSWKSALSLKTNDYSFFDFPIPSGPVKELLSAAILGRDGQLVVTATRDLNVYYQCPLFWLYSRIFRTEEFSLEATLLDDTSLGLLYHVILEKLFEKIKDEDAAFNSRRLDTYKKWALEITRAAIREHPAFKGPLAVPLVSPQAAGMAKKISGLLDLEAKYFDGYAVAELELPVSFRTGDLLIKGVIDRVSVSPGGEPIIVDYKTSYLPEQTHMDELDETPLSEFQMPLYIKLYEESSGTKAREVTNKEACEVQGAYFYSINRREIKTVMGERAGGRNKAPGREEYGPFLIAAEKQIEEFAEKVKALDFIPRELRIGECADCAYKTACRSAYFLNRGPGITQAEGRA